MTVDGIARVAAYIGEERIGTDAITFTDGKAAERIRLTIPIVIRGILTTTERDLKVEIEFDPPVMPQSGRLREAMGRLLDSYRWNDESPH